LRIAGPQGDGEIVETDDKEALLGQASCDRGSRCAAPDDDSIAPFTLSYRPIARCGAVARCKTKVSGSANQCGIGVNVRTILRPPSRKYVATATQFETAVLAPANTSAGQNDTMIGESR